jgi:hypothetical protein
MLLLSENANDPKDPTTRTSKCIRCHQAEVPVPRSRTARDAIVLIASLAAIAALTAVLRLMPDVSPTTVALALLLVVPGTATLARLRIASHGSATGSPTCQSHPDRLKPQYSPRHAAAIAVSDP